MKNLNLTPRAQKLIRQAYELARKHNNKEISYLHFFTAFLSLNQDKVNKAFAHFKVDVSKLLAKSEKFLKENYPSFEKIDKDPILTKESKILFQNAKVVSSKYDHKYVGLEHVFISLFITPDNVFKLFLSKNESFDKIVDFVEKSLEEDDFSGVENTPTNEELPEQNSIFNNKKYKTLNSCAINLNEQVANGKINNLHINEKLVKKLSEILCRKNKNNPIIVGEAGVGKTALVESLAKSIVEGKCSDFVLLKQIYSLDISMIVAGCKYRGEFEEKIKNILKEIANDPYVVLFIDEIHTIIGAGNPENGLDVANILKPYLARGEISCIGATTLDEYNKKIANDPALSRRFQMVKIEEPTKQEAIDLINNIKVDYQNFHVVEFDKEIIEFIVEMSDRYIQGRFPDKALDIIDQVGAKCKLKNFSKTQEMINIENSIKDLDSKRNEKNNNKTEEKILKHLTKYQALADKMISNWKNNKYKVQKDDVVEVISDKINIPVEDLKCEDSDRLFKLKETLRKKIIGQQTQIDQIHKCLTRAKAGFRSTKRPISSFLFGGPTGVGKTMTGKLMAQCLFENKNSFIHVDMSEYTDSTATNKIIGSAPGYVGFEKEGNLADKVRKNPYSLILFDEIQEAHRDVVFLICQILEEGRITDSSGKIVDFSNCIIVLASNIGNVAIAPVIGFGEVKNTKQQDSIVSIQKYFPADLLNRIDEIVVFETLSNENIKKIIKNELDNLKYTLNEKAKDLVFAEDLIEYIFKKIQFNNFGARQVSKTIQRELETILAEDIFKNPTKKVFSFQIENENISVI